MMVTNVLLGMIVVGLASVAGAIRGLNVTISVNWKKEEKDGKESY